MNTVIKVDELTKKYRLQHRTSSNYSTLRESLFNIGSIIPGQKKGRSTAEDFWALNGVSFEVKDGERLGIIGRNGAGKSTLLKLLSRITEPTTGSIRIQGRVASLLEVGTGFHPELTGRENVFLNGSILGMSRGEIKRKFDEIVAFAEVEQFLDTPVKRYSSGMYVRLAFSVAAHLEPEILIVDEVLAVGDAAFQKKCIGKMEDVGKSGRTLLFVSHNMAIINQLCNRSILLNKGKVVFDGDSSEATDLYMKGGTVSAEAEKLEWSTPPNYKNYVPSIIRIEGFRVIREDGSVSSPQIFTSIKYKIKIDADILIPDRNLTFFISVLSDDGTILFLSDIHDSGPEIQSLLNHKGKKSISVELPVDILLSGHYQLEVSCVVHYKGWALLPDSGQRLFFTVHRDSILNPMGYDEVNHPYTGSKRPGYFSPLLQWQVENNV